jgi:hypothetical protein
VVLNEANGFRLRALVVRALRCEDARLIANAACFGDACHPACVSPTTPHLRGLAQHDADHQPPARVLVGGEQAGVLGKSEPRTSRASADGRCRLAAAARPILPHGQMGARGRHETRPWDSRHPA